MQHGQEDRVLSPEQQDAPISFSENGPCDNFFALCGVFHTEYDYLPEFVDWWVWQGVRKFVLYQNDPGPLDVARVSTRWAHLIELVDWRDHSLTKAEKMKSGGIQRSAYDHYLEKHAGKTAWTAIVDIDEFMMPKTPAIYATV